MSWEGHFLLLFGALVLDAAVGDPDSLWRRVAHPVVLIGHVVGWLERLLNPKHASPGLLRASGLLAIALLVVLSVAIGYGLQRLFDGIAYGWIGTVLVLAILLAGRSLHDHVNVVASAFDVGGLPAARQAVARIVGRDPESLDESGVCRAAIESTAENFSDGVVAPAFWFAVLGLPGVLAYKAINTADSMIGHRTQRYRDFGWASARLDDLVNLPASRLAGFLIAIAAPLAGGNFRQSFGVMLADAGKHRSPNAGWPEAAMAGALGIALAGPRRYGGALVDDPLLNAAGRAPQPGDIRNGLRVYLGAWAFLALAVAALAALL